MMRRFALASLAAHGLIVAGLLFRPGQASPPPEGPPPWAKVELLQLPEIGDSLDPGAKGEAETQATAPAPAPAAVTPPPTPTPTEAQPPTPPPAPAYQEATASVPLPPPPPPTQPAPPRPARTTPATPPPKSPSPPTDTPPTQSSTPPAIRLGDGDAYGTALSNGSNIIPAALDSHVRNRQPNYPEESARQGESGTVILMVHVAPDGSARSVEVQTTSGFERLDRAAREAVARWHFQPAIENGAPVASDLPLQVRFILKE